MNVWRTKNCIYFCWEYDMTQNFWIAIQEYLPEALLSPDKSISMNLQSFVYHSENIKTKSGPKCQG